MSEQESLWVINWERKRLEREIKLKGASTKDSTGILGYS